MNTIDDVNYRLNLARGFLKEAEEDFGLKRWRSCVDNSQLSAENFGKAVLMLFGLSPKTHDPARHLSLLLQDEKLPKLIKDRIKDLLPNVIMLGVEEHFMTDYGDESSYRLPWEIFDEDSAVSALQIARNCKPLAEDIVEQVQIWRSSSKHETRPL